MTTFVSLFEEMPLFGEFDFEKNTPVSYFDPKDLVKTVAILWENAKRHRLLFEAFDKEMSKRRTEMEVKLSNMQNSFEGLIKNEAKKREKDDDDLRDELRKLREQYISDLKKNETDAKARENALESSFLQTTKVLSENLNTTQDQVKKLTVEVDELKRSLHNAGDRSVDKNDSLDLLEQKYTQLCSFIGTTPETVAVAIKTRREKESFLGVPALQDLANRIRNAEDVSNATAFELKSVEKGLSDAKHDIIDNKNETDRLKNSLRDTETRITDDFSNGDTKLHRRIDDLSQQVVNSFSQTKSFPEERNDLNISNAFLENLSNELSDLSRRMRKAEEKITKHDIEKADKIEIDPLLDSINKLRDWLNMIIKDIEELKNHAQHFLPVHPQMNQPQFNVQQIQPHEDPRIDEILKRLADAEKMCSQLDDVKADKADVNNALKDLMKRIEKALNGLLARIQDLEARTVLWSESTAGRFRCLSCNRNAGPLQEQLQERMSSPLFPPSNMFVQSRPGSSQTQTQTIIPGMRDYGGGLTSSRKKLMNYYNWLQERADSPTHTTQATSNAADHHPSPGHVDNSSLDPEAVGSDGKYYSGINSRPVSARRQAEN